jgi:hypothetical protein
MSVEVRTSVFTAGRRRLERGNAFYQLLSPIRMRKWYLESGTQWTSSVVSGET